jgi:hypothetical protein
MSGASVLLVKDSAGTALAHLKADSADRLEVKSTPASGVTQDVDIVAQSVGTLAVGDSTAQSSLASIDGKLPAALGQDVMADSLSVVIASNQSAVSVSDSTAQASLSSIDGKISQGYDATIASGGSGAQQVLCYGLDTGGNLDALRVDASGHLEITVDDFVKGQDVMANSFPVVIASDQSAIPVTTSVTPISTTDTAVFSATSVGAGSSADSTAVDLDAVDRSITISGVFTDTTGEVQIHVSHDGTTYYELTSEYVQLDFSSGQFGITLPGLGARYLRLKAVNNSGSGHTITARVAYKS